MFDKYIEILYDELIKFPTNDLFLWDEKSRMFFGQTTNKLCKEHSLNIYYSMIKIENEYNHIAITFGFKNQMGSKTIHIHKEDLRKWKLKKI